MAYAIGDIHGCPDELDKLISLLPKKEKIVFLGDYIDRGPDVKGVVDRLLLEKNRSVFLLGNHEAMMLAYFQDRHSDMGENWANPLNGGEATFRSYGLNFLSKWEDIQEDHRLFFENLLLYYEDENFIGVHAGVRIIDSIDLKKQNKEDLLWIREDWIRNESLWKGKKIFYGHTPGFFIERSWGLNTIEGKNSLGIDTGCVFGGKLTAVDTTTGELIQVPAAKRYY